MLLRKRSASRSMGRHIERILESAGDGIVGLHPDGTASFVNQAAARLLGYTPEEMVGQPLHRLIHHTRTDGSFYPEEESPIYKALHSGEVERVENEDFWRKDGSSLPVDYVSTPLFIDSRLAGGVVIFREISERNRIEHILRHQATHDTLTGLPNRTLLYDRLSQALRHTQRNNEPGALLFLDLNRFKDINDTLGHHYGDLLLQQVADRLKGTLRATDTVARLGGDEFAIILPKCHREGAITTSEKLAAALSQPLLVEKQVLSVSTGVGIALFPDHGVDEQTLLRLADVAMYVAKQSQRTYTVYSPDLDTHSAANLALIPALRTALVQRHLSIHYQPKIEPASGQIAGVEALVRWMHPEYGLITPDQFISVAEHSGLIGPLALYVLEEAIAQCQKWLAHGLEVNIAVNLSMWNLRDPMLPELIGQLLDRYQLPAHMLTVELTETTIMANARETIAILSSLRALGLRIAVDDFGVGYSSLAHIRRLPVDELKIDKSFVLHMAEEDADARIVSATIGLGHTLGLKVVAEGVENECTYELLTALECDVVQGYYFSRPLPATQLESWIVEYQAALPLAGPLRLHTHRLRQSG